MNRLLDRMQINTPNRMLLLVLGVWWLVNLLQAGFTELANDEAYYFMFAQNLSWGYFDHPPMTALLVWLGGFAGGELGVRLFFTLLQPIYVYVLWRIVWPAVSDAPATRGDVGLFVLLMAAMPIMQLYGFIAVPDGPLMLFTALFLYAFKRFRQNQTWTSVVMLGVCMAALAYSKYHGALVVFFTVASAWRLLKNPRFYVAGLVALLLIMPHLMWQYNHNWLSFSYHLTGRNRPFEWAFVIEYLLNILAIFNPFLFPIAAKAWWKSRASDPTLRAMSCIAAGFILFFLASTLRGYVQPQWEIPATFGIVALLFGYVREREALRRYSVRLGWITLFLIGLVRIEMIFNPINLRFEIFNNRSSNAQLSELAAGRPIIFAGGYTQAAKFNFYTGGTSFAQPTIYSRSSQYELLHTDEEILAKEVIVEVDAKQNLEHTQCITLANGKIFTYIVDSCYIPIRKVRITPTLPDSLAGGDTLAIHFTITNPYQLPFIVDGDRTRVQWTWYTRGETLQVIDLPTLREILPPQTTIRTQAWAIVPKLTPGATYTVGFTIRNSDGPTWYNGPRKEIFSKP